MSWYKRRPRVKEPSKSIPHTSSPMTEKRLETMKESVRSQEKQPKKIK